MKHTIGINQLVVDLVQVAPLLLPRNPCCFKIVQPDYSRARIVKLIVD